MLLTTMLNVTFSADVIYSSKNSEVSPAFVLKCLLCLVQSDGNATYSLKSLCDGATRSQAATTFFCLLVLSKQKSLHLQQDGPYEDVLVIPGHLL